MSEAETVASVLLALTIGGGLGAKQTGVAVWRGSVLAALAFIATTVMLQMADSKSFLIAIVTLIVTGGIVGGVMGLKAQQISIILIGSLILGAITIALVGL